MDYIYVITGLLTTAFAIAGLVLTCYLEQRWMNSRKRGPDKNPSSGLSEGGLTSG